VTLRRIKKTPHHLILLCFEAAMKKCPTQTSRQMAQQFLGPAPWQRVRPHATFVRQPLTKTIVIFYHPDLHSVIFFFFQKRDWRALKGSRANRRTRLNLDTKLLPPVLCVEVEVTLWLTVSQSICLGIEYPCGTCDQILLSVGMLLSEICGLVSMGRPLWREDGSVLCSRNGSYFTTDRISWYRAPLWDLQPDITSCLKFA
jgi:hypothetical protein